MMTQKERKKIILELTGGDGNIYDNDGSLIQASSLGTQDWHWAFDVWLTSLTDEELTKFANDPKDDLRDAGISQVLIEYYGNRMGNLFMTERREYARAKQFWETKGKYLLPPKTYSKKSG